MLIHPSRLPLALAAGLAALVLLAALSFALGAFPVGLREVAGVLWHAAIGGDSGVAERARAVVLEIRGPRIVAALAVGAALGAAGAAYQNVFRNPLVSPDLLGVSSGCALGAVIGILAGGSGATIQLAAFVGGVAASALVVALGVLVRGHDRTLTFVLAGVVVAALFSAGVAFAKTLADPYNQLPAITFWLLGGFGGVMTADVAMALPLIAGGIAVLALVRWQVNALALADDEARALGIDVARMRIVVIAAATLATSSAVAIAGVIGWVGLVVPHAARLIAGPAFARVLPLAAIFGAGFLLAVDTLCRAFAQGELPPGVVTAIVGTPAFIALLAVSARRVP